MVLAVIALVQIRQRGQKGTGLAIGGIIATLLWIVVGFVVVIVLALNAGPVRNSNGEIVSAGRISVDDLRIGDCVNGLDQEGGVSRLDAVPCSQPHEGQVFATFDLPAGPWPGEDELFAMAEQGCHDRMETDLPEVYDDLSVKLFYLHPSEKLWRDGNREVICFAYHPEKRTGSVFD